MSRYYPYGVFCDKYGCWCDDVVDITDGNNECNGDCSNCQYSAEPTIGLAMFTTRTIKDGRLEFNIDDGLDQDLLRYCNEICQESCGADFDPACGDCHVTRLYYAMMRLGEYEDTGLTPTEVTKLQHRNDA